MQSHHSPLKSLIALAAMGAVLEQHRARLAARAPTGDSTSAQTGSIGEAAQQDPDRLGLGDLLGEIFCIKPPAATPDAQGLHANGCGSCDGQKAMAIAVEIPQHIAEAAGMNTPGFDPNSPSGRVIGLLAAAQTQALALGESNPVALEVSRYKHASACIGVAIGMLGQQAL